MKKNILLLFLTFSLILIGCGDVQSVSKATIHFNDGSSMELNNKTMSEEEYEALSTKLTIPNYDVSYKFKCKTMHNTNYNTTISGSIALYNDVEYQNYTDFTFLHCNFDGVEMYSIKRKSSINNYWGELKYSLYNDSLDTGVLNLYCEDNNDGSYHSVNEDNHSKLAWRKFNDFIGCFPPEESLKNNFIFEPSLSFGSTTDEITVTEDYFSFSVPITHSHQLTQKYLIIEEKSLSFPKKLPLGPAAYQVAYWREITSNNYYVKSQRYFDLNSGCLVKMIYFMDTLNPIDYYGFPGYDGRAGLGFFGFSGTITFDFKLNHLPQLGDDINNLIKWFVESDGVVKN